MAIHGDCVSATQAAGVLVSQLAADRCDLVSETGTMLAEGEASLWIGAIGPLAVVAEERRGKHVIVRFREPLDPRIVDHFKGA